MTAIAIPTGPANALSAAEKAGIIAPANDEIQPAIIVKNGMILVNTPNTPLNKFLNIRIAGIIAINEPVNVIKAAMICPIIGCACIMPLDHSRNLFTNSINFAPNGAMPIPRFTRKVVRLPISDITPGAVALTYERKFWND